MADALRYRTVLGEAQRRSSTGEPCWCGHPSAGHTGWLRCVETQSRRAVRQELHDQAAADAVRMARDALRQHEEYDMADNVRYCLGCPALIPWPCDARADALAVIERWTDTTREDPPCTT